MESPNVPVYLYDTHEGAERAIRSLNDACWRSPGRSSWRWSPRSKALVATGALSQLPTIPGLAEAGYLTNANLFDIAALPASLLVIGGGPLGCELARVFARFGSRTIIAHREPLFLLLEERDAARMVSDGLARDGVEIHLNTEVASVRAEGGRKVVELEIDGNVATTTVNQILTGIGRLPAVQGLDLEAAAVAYDATSGIHVDDFLRTTNRRVYAAGDVCLDSRLRWRWWPGWAWTRWTASSLPIRRRERRSGWLPKPACAAVLRVGRTGWRAHRPWSEPTTASSPAPASSEFISVHSQKDSEGADIDRERAELKRDPRAGMREPKAIYVARGLDSTLAQQVSQQLMAKDTLGAHVGDELGVSEATAARPIQAAIASAASFSVGAVLPPVVVATASQAWLIGSLASTSLVFLAALGAASARIGGAPVWSGTWRLAFWGAMAMAVTSGVGALFGVVA